MKTRYREFTLTVLIAAFALNGYRAVRGIIVFLRELLLFIEGRKTMLMPSGELNSYLGYIEKPDPSDLIRCLAMFLGMAMFTTAVILIIIRGTKNRVLPVIFCMGGLTALLSFSLERLTFILFAGADALYAVAALAVTGAVAALMIMTPKINRSRTPVIAVSAVMFAAAGLCWVMRINVISLFDVFAAALALIGFAQAAWEDSAEEQQKD